MFYFYSDSKQPITGDIAIWNMNGTRCYLTHYDNYLFLQFVSNNKLSSEMEKKQARHEQTICEKKLEFWKRHPKYVHEDAVAGIALLKKNWRTDHV